MLISAPILSLYNISGGKTQESCGNIPFGKAPLSYNVANVLSELPVIEYVGAEAWIESSIYMPNRKLV